MSGQPRSPEGLAAVREWRRQVYALLEREISDGPGWEDPSQAPSADEVEVLPRYALVTVSNVTGHAWVTLHRTPHDAALSLAEDVDVHEVEVDEARSFLLDLDTALRTTPTIVTRVEWSVL